MEEKKKRALGNGEAWKANINIRSQNLSVWCRLNLTGGEKAPVPSYIWRAPTHRVEERVLRQRVDDLIVLFFPFWMAEMSISGYLCALHWPVCRPAGSLMWFARGPEGKDGSPYRCAGARWAYFLHFYVLLWISLNSADVMLSHDISHTAALCTHEEHNPCPLFQGPFNYNSSNASFALCPILHTIFLKRVGSFQITLQGKMCWVRIPTQCSDWIKLQSDFFFFIWQSDFEISAFCPLIFFSFSQFSSLSLRVCLYMEHKEDTECSYPVSLLKYEPKGIKKTFRFLFYFDRVGLQ